MLDREPRLPALDPSKQELQVRLGVVEGSGSKPELGISQVVLDELLDEHRGLLRRHLL